MGSTPPTSVIRDGNLKATIWENNSDKGTYYTTTFAKTYRDQKGDLRDTNAFTNGDLLRVSELAREARSKTRELYQENSKSNHQERAPENTPENTSENVSEHSQDQSQSSSTEYEQGEGFSQSYDQEF